MKICASFELDNKFYVVTAKGYCYVIFEKDGRGKTLRISQQEFESRRAEKYNY